MLPLRVSKKRVQEVVAALEQAGIRADTVIGIDDVTLIELDAIPGVKKRVAVRPGGHYQVGCLMFRSTDELVEHLRNDRGVTR